MKTIMVVMALFLFALVVPAYSQSDKDEEACCDRSDWPKEACLDGNLNSDQLGEVYKSTLEGRNFYLSRAAIPYFRELLEMHRAGHFDAFKKAHPNNFKKDVDVVHMNYTATLKTHHLILWFLDTRMFYHETRGLIVVTEGYRPETDKNERGKTNPACSPHVLGYAIDIRPGSTDGAATDWRWKNYDRKVTQGFVDYVHEIDPCAKMLFNDPNIKGVKPCDDHDDHIHITWSLNDMPAPKVATFVVLYIKDTKK